MDINLPGISGNVHEFMNVLDGALKFSETGLGDANKIIVHAIFA